MRPPKLPATIKIGYRDIILKMVDTDPETEDRGTFHSSKGELTVSANLLPPDQAETMLHELLHACWPSGPLPADVEEGAVSAMAPVLSQIVRDNPLLVKWIVHSLA